MDLIHSHHKLLGQRETFQEAIRVQVLLLPLSGYVALRMFLGLFKPQVHCV